MPSSWLWISGIPREIDPLLGVIFHLLGAYLLAVALLAELARRNSGLRYAASVVLLCAVTLDLGCAYWAWHDQVLPTPAAIVFCLIDLFWIVAFSWLLVSRKTVRK